MGFNRSRNIRRDELTDNKYVKGKHHLRNMLKDVFGSAEHQEKATYGLRYKLTLTRNKNEAVIDKVAGIADGRIKIDHIHWYILHYTPSIQQRNISSNRFLKKIPSELRYIERPVFMKEVNYQNLWNCEKVLEKA